MGHAYRFYCLDKLRGVDPPFSHRALIRALIRVKYIGYFSSAVQSIKLK
jgi:hypothetical protein